MANRTAAVIEIIEHFRLRMGMYIHPKDVPNTRSFLAGVAAGASTCGIRRDWDVYRKVLKARGWNAESPIGPEQEMEERGADSQQIMDELITIEIEVLRQSNIEGGE